MELVFLELVFMWLLDCVCVCWLCELVGYFVLMFFVMLDLLLGCK